MTNRICKTCETPLIIKQTRRTQEQLKKQYYYTSYYYCPRCHKMYLDDEFKVVNQNNNLFGKEQKHLVKVDVEIWTDGACAFNGQENAKAAWGFVSGKYEANGLVFGKQTNNTAEGYAVYYALLWAVENGHKKIKVYTDSQITIHNLNKSYENVKLNQEIFSLIHDIITTNNLTIWYEKVPGHAGNINNERADKLANSLVGIR